MIWENRGDKTLFVVGSSGVEYALVAHWQRIKLISKPEPFSSPGAVEQLIVVSGSAAPATASQITWALERGYKDIRLDTVKLVDPALAQAERARAIRQALSELGAGRSVVLYTTLGAGDPAIQMTNQRLRELGFDAGHAGQRLGDQLGKILRALLEETGLRRACVAGGDTSGYVARQLGIYALEMIIPIAPGSPLCRASSHEPAFDGLEISLKGGQVGQADYFGLIQAGGKLVQ